jgi:hypothetical protein
MSHLFHLTRLRDIGRKKRNHHTKINDTEKVFWFLILSIGRTEDNHVINCRSVPSRIPPLHHFEMKRQSFCGKIIIIFFSNVVFTLHDTCDIYEKYFT